MLRYCIKGACNNLKNTVRFSLWKLSSAHRCFLGRNVHLFRTRVIFSTFRITNDYNSRGFSRSGLYANARTSENKIS
ncbi:Protein CBG25987 [Caenorhabditis briggsae]|uniref:Protein CBG25987 n=1 Tax=Caenorhabditis briggsae TaxID=6238 RepID=B6IKT7_CAEBR|nr:Protein CBG25987 [Caenorhabditis briggsae]CAS00517.1 Protein CBG25987 [Caenorhabditis briggsae]